MTRPRLLIRKLCVANKMLTAVWEFRNAMDGLSDRETFRTSDFQAGVISRGAQGGGALLVKISVHFGGLSPPKILALA